MKRAYLLAVIMVVFMVFLAWAVWAEENSSKIRIAYGVYRGQEVAFNEGEILVKFKDEIEPRIINIPDGTVIEWVAEYQKRNDVEYAQPNFIYIGAKYLPLYSPLPKAEGILNGKKIQFIDGQIRVKYKGEANERIIKVPEGRVIQKVLEWRKKQETDKSIQYVEPSTLQKYDMEQDR